MILSESTQKITISTSVVSTTNQLSYTAFIVDKNPALTSGSFVQSRGLFDNPGADIVTYPTLTSGVTYPKMVMEFSVINLDTVAHTVSFTFVSSIGTVDVPIFKVTIQPGELVLYTKEKGWQVMDSTGNLKEVNVSAGDTKRNKTWATAPSLTMDAANYDINIQNNTEAVGPLVMNAPTGTPTNGQELELHIKSTNVQTFTWDAIFAGSVTTPLPVATSGATKTDKFFFEYNLDVAKWQLINVKLGYT